MNINGIGIEVAAGCVVVLLWAVFWGLVVSALVKFIFF